jgi:hypothetical protein
MVQEVKEHLEDLRPQGADAPGAAKGIEACVKLTASKDVRHDFLCQTLASGLATNGTLGNGGAYRHSITVNCQEFRSKLPGKSQVRCSQAMYRTEVYLALRI